MDIVSWEFLAKTLATIFFSSLFVYWFGQILWTASYWVRDAWCPAEKRVWPLGRVFTKDIDEYMIGGFFGSFLLLACLAFWFITFPALVVWGIAFLLRGILRLIKSRKEVTNEEIA